MVKKNKEFKDESVEALQVRFKELDRKLFLLRDELSVNRKVEQPHLLKLYRKDKARVLTFLTQKQNSKHVKKEA